MRATIVLFAVFLATAADACTTFCTRGLFGRNYDFEIGNGLVIVNKRGMAKASNTDAPAQWTSRYGSVTFNQYGRDNPTGGMNEKGLVIELMWLSETRYPRADRRPALGTLEWIQYQLDTASTVNEIIASLAKVRIIENGVPLHYLVADASGDVAAIEFLNGEPVVHRNAKALANDPYEESLRTMHGRFARASQGAATIDEAFKVLDDVAQPTTRWSIVYDIRKRAVTWRTSVNRARRTLSFASLDFSCASPAQLLDIDAGRGDVRALFRDYTRARNAELVRRSTRNTSFLRDTPDAEIEETARWPERSTCSR